MTERLETHPRFLRVHFDQKAHADFHWVWLRHECTLDRHPQTGERTLCASRIAPDVTARSAAIEGDALVVSWSTEAASRPASRFPLAWLREHAYAPDRVEPALPDRTTRAWEAKLVGGDEVLPDGFYEQLEAHGAVVARSPSGRTSPEHTERLVDQLARRGLSIVATHFGRIEDLRTDNTTNQNTDQLGYTDAPIDLHTDQPFLPRPPRFQMLHVMQPADAGGESLLVDARAVAEWIEANDADAYRRLTTTPVHFHRRQKAFEKLHVGPILGRTDDGSFELRFSYFTMAPHRLPFAEMDGWYRAYALFATLMRERASQFALGPGDALLYDNRRMAHGRTGFTSAGATAQRWLRGVYFDPA